MQCFLRDWREGMSALAALPGSVCKLSMFPFLEANLAKDAGALLRVRDRVREVIGWFGAERCCFASNYPVDQVSGISPSMLANCFAEIAEVYSDEQKEWLYERTAAECYRLS